MYADIRIERTMGIEITYYLGEFLLPPCNILKLLEKYLITNFIFLLTFLCFFGGGGLKINECVLFNFFHPKILSPQSNI